MLEGKAVLNHCSTHWQISWTGACDLRLWGHTEVEHNGRLGLQQHKDVGGIFQVDH